MSGATIRDVAKQAGVSVASVSRALNDRAHVNSATRARILEVVGALGYVPHAGARSLSMARSHAIGVVLPDLFGEFFSELVRGMDRAASAAGYQLLLSNMHADAKLAAQAAHAMRGRVDGLVIVAPQLTAAQIEATLLTALPAVLINTEIDDKRHVIAIDNYAGTKTIIGHLLGTGRRQIVHIAGPENNVDGRERLRGYLDTMMQSLPGHPARVIDGDFHQESGVAAAQMLIAEGLPCDAIFAANDMMAIGAIHTLRESGVDVPGRVAVAGFDDIPLAHYLSVTTMRVHVDQIGERAIERVRKEIEEQEGSHGRESITPELIIRGSTK